MELEILLGFKSGQEQRARFEIQTPEKVEGEDPKTQKEKAFAKVVRMVMHKDMKRGFINTGDFGFRIEDVSYMKLLF
jgi:hypothetical protein